MSKFPKILMLMIAACWLSGCFATRYNIYQDDGPEVRMTGMLEDEEFVRTVNIEVREHYFLLGLISDESNRDIARTVQLAHDEILTDLQIENSFSEIDAAIVLISGLLTQGVGPAIWSTQTSRISGNIARKVATSPSNDLVPKVAPEQENPPEPPAPQPEPEAAEPKWISLQQSLTYDAAISGCKDAGGRLPTRKELAQARENGVTPSVGDVWTSDGSGDEVYTFDTNTGATFFRPPTDSLSVICVGTE